MSEITELEAYRDVNVDAAAYMCEVEKGVQPLTKLHYMGLALYVCYSNSSS